MALTRIAFFLCFSASAFSMCWQEAGEKYGVDPQILYAIAQVESGLNPGAVGKVNADGSYDIGLMQINSGWLPTLRKYGITKDHLLNDPCVNLNVGAWILANNISRLGYNWDAIGAYNAASKNKRVKYAWKVYKKLQ